MRENFVPACISKTIKINDQQTSARMYTTQQTHNDSNIEFFIETLKTFLFHLIT